MVLIKNIVRALILAQFVLFILACGKVQYIEQLNDKVQKGLNNELIDSDNDGIPDDIEITLGTDPNDEDSDDDGLLDGEEVNTYFTDPNDKDTDGGGVIDGDEVKHGTNPLDNPADDRFADPDRDTDSDGLSDADENEIGTDPDKEDTDNDGLLDGEEVNTYHTDPNKKDTDNGGVNDGDEVKHGTNPVDNPNDDKYCISTNSVVAWREGERARHSINPFVGLLSAKTNYNYYSWSAHPKIGPTPEDNTLYIYLYKSPKGTSLFFHAGEDNNSKDKVWEDLYLDIKVESTNPAKIIVADDRNELRDEGNGLFKARMSYKRNTDGGVIGYFDASNFKIAIDVVKATHIDKIIVASLNSVQTIQLSKHSNEKMTIKLESQKAHRCMPIRSEF